MAGDLQKISDLQTAYFQLLEIRKQIDTLEDFLVSTLRKETPQSHDDPGVMIDPRTGKEFKTKG